MTIAAERYLAVCHPFKHAYFTKSKTVMVLSLIYVLGIICNGGSAFQVNIALPVVEILHVVMNPEFTRQIRCPTHFKVTLENGGSRFLCMTKTSIMILSLISTLSHEKLLHKINIRS